MPGKIIIQAYNVEQFGQIIGTHTCLVYVNGAGVKKDVISGNAREGFWSGYGSLYAWTGDWEDSYEYKKDLERPDLYIGSVELNLDGRDASAVWELMIRQAHNITDAHLDYDLYGILGQAQTCNSLTTTVMHAVGLQFMSAVDPAWGSGRRRR